MADDVREQGMTGPAALLSGCLALGLLAFPAEAQELRVSAGGSISTVKASTARAYPTFPITLLEQMGGVVTSGDGWVEATLLGDVLHFRPMTPHFRLNRESVALTNWTFKEAGTLYLPQRFFIEWLPTRYPDRVAYRDGVLTFFGSPDSASGGQEGATTARRSSRRAARETPKPGEQSGQPVSSSRGRGRGRSHERDPEDLLPGRLQGFVDTRLSGVYDSNVDREASPQGAYGTAGRLGVGLQSSASRPFLTARYDLGFYRYAEATESNRTTHDVSAELAPSIGPIRPKVGGEVRVGSWTEDRELADQLALRLGLEVWPSRTVLVELHGAQRVRQISGTVERADTNRVGGLLLARRWKGGGRWAVDGRYEDNRSERASSRYQSWSARTMLRMPVSGSERITLELTHRQRRYRERLVTVGADEVPRRDRRWSPAVSATHAWAGGHWELEAAYELDHNTSNDFSETYVAHRIGFGLRRRW
jgi:hypothetical protein